MRVVSTFSVIGWEPTVTDDPADGPSLSRVEIRKAFEGELAGESVGEGLFCGMGDPASGAGYLVSERITGRVGEREGSFVLQHGGLMGPDVEPHTFGSIVPGSGTGGLTGISGSVELTQPDGQHTMTLEVEFADAG